MDRRGTTTVAGVWWIAALAVLVLLCLSRGFEISPIRPGLDPSYLYALNHATVHSLSWGQDFISTYGPYGFYFTTYDLGDLPARKVVLALLLAGGAGVTATLLVWREAGIPTWLRLVSLGLLLYTFVIQILEYQVVGFLVLLLLFAVREGCIKGLVAFGSAGLLAGFCMLVKFSLGFGALLTVAIACLVIGRPRLILSRAWVALAGALAGLLGGWQLYQGSPRGLSTFLRSGWDVAGGYSAAMGTAEIWPIGVGAFLLWIGLLVVWVVSWRASRPLRSLAVLAIPLFVAWKHSVVRQDVHVKILVLFGLFSMAILLLDAAVLGRWRRALPVVVLLTALLITPWYSLPAPFLELVRKAPVGPCPTNTLESNLSQPLRLCGLRGLAEWRDPAAMRRRLEAETRAELRPDLLPASMRTRIGSAAVDVYPWEIAYVPANTLVWANRPLPASFNAYTASLDRLNRVLRVGPQTAVSPLARSAERGRPSLEHRRAVSAVGRAEDRAHHPGPLRSGRGVPGRSPAPVARPASLRRTRPDPARGRGLEHVARRARDVRRPPRARDDQAANGGAGAPDGLPGECGVRVPPVLVRRGGAIPHRPRERGGRLLGPPVRLHLRGAAAPARPG